MTRAAASSAPAVAACHVHGRSVPALRWDHCCRHWGQQRLPQGAAAQACMAHPVLETTLGIHAGWRLQPDPAGSPLQCLRPIPRCVAGTAAADRSITCCSWVWQRTRASVRAAAFITGVSWSSIRRQSGRWPRRVSSPAHARAGADGHRLSRDLCGRHCCGLLRQVTASSGRFVERMECVRSWGAVPVSAWRRPQLALGARRSAFIGHQLPGCSRCQPLPGKPRAGTRKHSGSCCCRLVNRSSAC